MEGGINDNPLLENELEANNGYSTKGNSSFFKAFFNGLNALTGVGILSVPYALASGGWLSLLLIFIVAMAAFYTGLLVKRCMEADPSIRTYPDIGDRAFGKIGRTIISVFMCSELYLVVTGFLIMEGDNLHNLFPELTLNTYGLKLGGKESFVLIIALIILPSVWLDDLSILSYISATGVLASVVIIVSILWVGTFDGIGFHGKGDLLNWSGIPTTVSLYGFCYCAHPVFPALYHSMEKKHQFAKVLILCFVCSTIAYASMAIIGYLMFGSEVDSQITLNLPTDAWGSKIAIYTTLVNPLSKYALMLEPVVNSTESWFPDYHKKRYFKILLRTSLVISQVTVALVFPYFGNLMSLVGAFLSISASITLPCLCYLKITGNYLKGEGICVLGTVALSILIAIFGTYTSLVQIIQGTTEVV
ncbi:amino acid transporter AVT1I isoform X1 [Beta vulgaris subsp. vulgaris]|uniref:amino acid transporter AVT1I isoform X1 n=2 Tax=Beta vulgaris subsp. vulgaris TaxID=3555 RepID=UPI002036764C|nr:amino acid transporter AVT1I isoform X1 [Beta vulgaris subsp. vulgaris]